MISYDLANLLINNWIASTEFKFEPNDSLRKNRTDIRTIQELLGHSNIATTSRYIHLTRKHLQGVQSPLDKIGGDLIDK
ncbi:MAG: tyrosine-type recombinase/integrase [Clostridia bacterium]|nr:tyrosine-type recombinase/integrase [Clostridia bacterium]